MHREPNSATVEHLTEVLQSPGALDEIIYSHHNNNEKLIQEKLVQARWGAIFEGWKNYHGDSLWKIADSHNKRWLGKKLQNRKSPDFGVFPPSVDGLIPALAAAVFDVKDGTFDGKGKGKLMRDLHYVLSAQPHRSFASGFLLSWDKIWFVVVHNNKRSEESATFDLITKKKSLFGAEFDVTGLRHLVSFLSQTPEQFGFNPSLALPEQVGTLARH